MYRTLAFVLTKGTQVRTLKTPLQNMKTSSIVVQASTLIITSNINIIKMKIKLNKTTKINGLLNCPVRRTSQKHYDDTVCKTGVARAGR